MYDLLIFGSKHKKSHGNLLITDPKNIYLKFVITKYIFISKFPFQYFFHITITIIFIKNWVQKQIEYNIKF